MIKMALWGFFLKKKEKNKKSFQEEQPRIFSARESSVVKTVWNT